ncbi:MAG: hypothetical protein WCO83_15120 [Alphaproteobacteria bacterium]
MSAAVGWVAVKGLDRKVMLDRLNLVESGEASNWDFGEFACAETAEGWLVVVACNSAQLQPRAAAKSLSSDHPALGAELKEGSFQSRCYGYEGGEEIWRLEHDIRVEVDGVMTTGNPPDALAEVLLRVKALASKSEDTTDWFYHVPPEVSLKICGFRADTERANSWILLEKRGRKPVHPKFGLRAAMQTDLLPFLLEQGWKPSQRPSNPGDIEEFEVQRVVGTYSQYLTFDYCTVPTPTIRCRILVWDDAGPVPRGVLQGLAQTPSARPSWIRNVLGLTRHRPEAVDIAIEQAKETFVMAQSYLDTGANTKGLEVVLMRSVKSWPEETTQG